MSNVVEFPERGRDRLNRESKAITLEQFCIADAKAQWTDRSVLNGMTILLYPNLTLTCCPGGTCSAVISRGFAIEPYFVSALAASA